MKHKLKRLTALILALSMALSLLCSSAWAAEVVPADAVDEAVAEVVAEDVEEAEDEPAEEVTEEPETPAVEVIPEEPAEEVAEPEIPEVPAEETEPEEVEAETAQPEESETLNTASSGTCGANLKWTLDDAGTLTISGTGAMTDYSNAYATPWNYNARLDTKSIVIKNGVTSIGDFAFNEFQNLTSVTIPASVTSIGYGAFQYCTSLSSVTIPDSVTNISYQAFMGCSSLTSITIPKSVTNIEQWAFARCENLQSIEVSSDNANYSSQDGVLFDKKQTTLLCFPVGKSGSYTIPDGVITIGFESFADCINLISVTIPNSVTSIDHRAFYGCTNLTSITIPNGVTSIGDQAFASCTNLTSVTIPNGVTSIGIQAFFACTSLTNVTIPYSVIRIDDQAFGYHVDAETWEETPIDGFTISGYTYSAAETYAQKHGIPFISIGEMPKTALSDCTITVAAATYTGKAITPAVTVKNGSTTLVKGTDYTVDKYSNNIDAGTATVTVTGIGRYTGTETRTFTISKAANTITASNVTKNAKTAAQSFSLGAKATGGTLSYVSNNNKIKVDKNGTVTVPANYYGTATITITAGDSNYTTVTKKVTVTVNRIANTITASNFTKNYSTKKQTFSLGVKRKGSGKITYSSNNKSITVSSAGNVTVKAKYIGTATITVKVAASGIYKATSKKITVTVRPTKTTLSSVKNSASKKMTVKWKKNTVGTGYQIQYSTSSTFAKGNKTVTVSKNTTTSKTISGLTKGKTYYVRICTYKTVSGKKICSAWSAKKSVKIKK